MGNNPAEEGGGYSSARCRVLLSRVQPEARERWARGVGIASIVLVYPLGLVLGPLSLWLGRSAIRRVSRGEIPPSDMGPAVAGAVIGALVCGIYLLLALADVVAILLFGSPIPAT